MTGKKLYLKSNNDLDTGRGWQLMKDIKNNHYQPAGDRSLLLVETKKINTKLPCLISK